MELPTLEKQLENLLSLFEGWLYPGTVHDLRTLLSYWKKNRELIYFKKDQRLDFIHFLIRLERIRVSQSSATDTPGCVPHR